ncbi:MULTISPECIES: DUF5794 domain-containing protein [unclassified Haladaptatus]|uniref:DUF5794 domain-containing protein n=1 Tax=unclassified Haladaptatus TaxID=2622732 RepID=UPI00209C2C73|nr:MULTISPECIES: DUF5794 domain-containing protein [unclassified Haladaptatus]MCO8245866.1 DUF5794 domain-containing protein [Haladaptatus sp. AB643]MCO8254560.1 DUF5794 domain-containing protein [Haladaptatus sp. AB618]
MSSSQHPVAYRLERQVGGATKLLATVMGLPLVDGIFPAMVLAGALSSPVGIIQVGLLVFGGSATVAVILAEMDGTPREQAMTVLAVGVVLIAVAGIEAAFAPTIASALKMETFERFAALVIAAIAAKTASARIGEYLPSPGVIVGFGLLASLQPAGFQVKAIEATQIVPAVAAAGTGVAFALAIALTSPWLRGVVDIDRFRFGSAVALGVLPLSILGFAPGRAPLFVLVVTSLLALDPGEHVESAVEAAEEAAGKPEPVAAEPQPAVDESQAAVTDGGENADEFDDGELAGEDFSEENLAEGSPEGDADGSSSAYGYPGEEDGGQRRPWL